MTTPNFCLLEQYQTQYYKNIVLKIVSKIIVTENNCWEWQHKKGGKGYGSIRVDGKYIGTHKFVYFYCVANTDLHICHNCDNPPCCNPKHLFAGTPRQNTEDCMKKGRFYPSLPTVVGQKHHKSVLTDNIVIEARALAQEIGNYPAAHKIATKYNVLESTVMSAIRYLSWKHLLEI